MGRHPIFDKPFVDLTLGDVFSFLGELAVIVVVSLAVVIVVFSWICMWQDRRLRKHGVK